MKSTLLSFILIFSSPSFAAEPATPARDNAQLISACKGDVEKLCKGIEVGGGRIIECLKKHKDEVSPGCKTATEEKREEIKKDFKEKRAEIHDACESDFETFCKGIHGPRNRIQCMKEHQDKLSAGCKAALPQQH